MSKLEEIFLYKKKEVEKKKSSKSIGQLEKLPFFNRKANSLKERLKKSSATQNIIAEFKRKSPSKGIINNKVNVKEVASGYIRAGAFGLSILTDEVFFGGSVNDLLDARGIANDALILRKDFTMDEYQVIETKSYGADIILLIAAMLTPQKIETLSKIANQVGLSVLLEVHTKEEIEKAPLDEIDAIGVNNRNLKSFEVSLETSLELIKYIPKDYIKISESGFGGAEDVLRLEKIGYDAFLIGETFMKMNNPVLGLKGIMEACKKNSEWKTKKRRL